MAGQFDGGIMGGILSGWRMGEEDTRTRQEFKARQEDAAFQRQRQQIADARTAQEHDWRVQDRPGEVAFRDEQRGQARQHWARDAALFQQGQEDRVRALNREPILQAREAELYGLDVEGRRQNIAAGRQQMRFAAENQAEQRRVRQRVWDEASLQDEIDKATRAVSPAFMRGQALGDWGPLKDAWNRTMGQHGAKVDAIESGPDGKIGVLVNGKQKIFNSADELQGFIADALDPTDAFAAMTENRKAARRQSAAGGDRTGPAELVVTDAIFQRLKNQPKNKGRSDDDLWMDAYSMQAKKAGMSREEAGASFYQAMMKDGIGGQNAHQRALDATQTFLDSFYTDQPARGAFDDVDWTQHRGEPSSRGGRGNAAPPEGTQVRGPDGRTYVVRNGMPVAVN